jgi:hypothetical protein
VVGVIWVKGRFLLCLTPTHAPGAPLTAPPAPSTHPLPPPRPQVALPIEWLQQALMYFLPITLQLPLAAAALLLYLRGWGRVIAATWPEPELAAGAAALCGRAQLGLAAAQGATMAVFG